MDVRAGRCWRIRRGEARSLKTNATAECLGYHREDKSKRKCMEAGQYPRRPSEPLKGRKLSCFSHVRQAVI